MQAQPLTLLFKQSNAKTAQGEMGVKLTVFITYQEWLQDLGNALLTLQCCGVHDQMSLIQNQLNEFQNSSLLSRLFSAKKTEEHLENYINTDADN